VQASLHLEREAFTRTVEWETDEVQGPYFKIRKYYTSSKIILAAYVFKLT